MIEEIKRMRVEAHAEQKELMRKIEKELYHFAEESTCDECGKDLIFHREAGGMIANCCDITYSSN